ncbi:uncharacterized protein DNG_00544 [Cephalotrichum gorgonifer]|uniref:Dpy-30 domain-containing protein n=1 Tax=Cephalotrichum gorgonifer TaxID=2041049 RepID=A0AAE8SRB6_9PEZI|nr:uncharacterized protein DNG_00544 [Cephalotrichum gorgonifer]
MSEPVNGSDNPPVQQPVAPTASPAPNVEPMDTTTDEPLAEPQASTQPEPTAAQPSSGITQTANTAASPAVEANAPTTPAADQPPAPGAQNVREILNTKVNPFLLAGLRQIFRDPSNIPDDPLRILGEFLLEKHREIVAKDTDPNQAKANGLTS